ncbi:MAG: hypothetical protein FGM55_03940, partial [Rhodoferax sp.]|nr:hypothetical protein [Rhodoferax sp.]
VARPASAAKNPRNPPSGGGQGPSAALAAVTGAEAVNRQQVIKKLWDYIRARGLQDPQDKRSIVADAPLLAVFGKPRATMFELAGIIGRHLEASS